jgi:hypothetical protein
MADTDKGGLSSVDPTTSFAQKLQLQTTESQRVLDEHRRRLMDLISSRQQMPFDPAMMSLAAGLLAPTKTGGFGESLSAGMTGYATEAEKQFRRQQEEAKLGYELEMAAQQQKRDLLGMQFMANMFGDEDQVAKPAAATTAPVQVAAAKTPAPVDSKSASARAEVVPAKAEAPSTKLESSVAKNEAAPVVDQTAAAAQALNMPELTLPEIPRNKIARMTDEQIAMLKTFNPSMGKILEEYRKAFRENRDLQIKEVNLQRDLQNLELAKRRDTREEQELGLKKTKSGLETRETEVKEESIKRNLPGVGAVEMPKKFWNELDKAESFDQVQKLYKKYNLPLNTTIGTDGQLRFMSPDEIEVKKDREKARFTQAPVKRQIPELGAGTYEINPIDFADYQAAKRKGPDALQLWFNQSEFAGQGVKIPGARIGNFGADSKPESVEDRAVREAREKRLAEKEAENTIALDGTIRNAGRQADGIIQNSDNLLDLMRKPEYSGAWGMFSGPGVKNAAVRFISDGINVGNFRVGIPAFETALKQAKMTDDQIEASVRAMQIYGEQKLQVARRDLAGEGSVSDGERRLVGDVSGGIDMPLKSAMALAELFKYRGEFDKKTATMYNQWRDKNPSMAGNRFFDTDEYRSLVKSYDKVMNDLRQKYYPSKSKPAEKSQSESQNSAPPKKGKDNPYLQGK